MVEIRRVPARRFGGTNKSNGSSPILSLRNLLIAMVVMQGVRLLMGSFHGKSSSSISSLPETQSDPMGLEARLKDSAGHIRKKPPSRPTPPQVIPQLEQKSQERDQQHLDQHESLSSEKDDKEAENPQDNLHQDGASHNEDLQNQVFEEPDIPAHERGEKSNGENHDELSPAKDLNPIVVDKKGTGATDVAYVKDFIHERDNPLYRSLEISATDVSPTVASLARETSVKPCETVGQDGKMVTNSACLDPDTPLIAYNPETFPRTWCGQEIKPKAAITMSEHCTDPVVHLFPADIPPISGEHMPPIIIKSNQGVEIPPSSLKTVECDIPCQMETDLNGSDWYVDNETWKIRHTMQDGWYEGHAKIERRDFMDDLYFSTQSWQSSVPLTYFSFEKHNLRNRPAIDFDTAKDKAAYIVDDQCSAAATKRSKYFNAMQAKIDVHSYGQCAHNTDVPEGMSTKTAEGRMALMKQYRIVLAFDTSKSKDHISDMVWEALMSGSVPVVVGAENLRDHLPPNSFINSGQFSNWDDLADYVKTVMSDKELWQSYQKWRTDEEALTTFDERYKFTRTSAECRTCRWAYAKKYGLGWDHAKQELRTMKAPREKFCTTADHGLVSMPFSETWVVKTEEGEKMLHEDSEGETCLSLTTDGSVSLDSSFNLHRKVIQHDGVTDFVISEARREHVDTEVALRLIFPGIRNPDGALFFNTHSLVSTIRGPKVSSATIQDSQMKVTLLADWETAITSTGEGILEVVIEKRDEESKEDNSLKRIRVIIEELALIHDKMTEFYPSSFGQMMTKDFVDPLGVFFSDS